jgi:AcrR family transcriptional regulator
MSIDGITVDDITATASVSKGSFYNHFADKDALARAVSDSIREQIESAVTTTNLAIPDPAQRVCRAICVFVAFALAEPVKARVMVMGYVQGVPPDTALNAGLHADLADGIAKGQFTIPSTLAATLLVMGTTFIALQNTLAPTAPINTTTQQLCTLLMRALGLPHDTAARTATSAVQKIIERNL